MGEVGVHRQRLGGGDEEAVGLPGAVALLKHLRQGDRLVVPVVDEDPEDHRVGPAVLPQPFGAGASRRLVALGFVVAFDVGAQGALTGIGAGGLVVGGLVRWHQQRGQRVDDGRLARADVAGEQRGVGAGGEPPHLIVEGAPVVDLGVLQAIAGPRGRPEVQRREQAVTHRRPPSPRLSPDQRLRRTPGACPRSPTGSGRRRRP